MFSASEARLDDEWAVLHRCREYLISQIDGAKVASILRQKDVLTVDQESQIIRDKDPQRQTETFLDILEMKPPGTFPIFLEIIGDLYPHVYLALTSDGKDEGRV